MMNFIRGYSIGSILQTLVRLLGLVTGALIAIVLTRTLPVGDFGTFSTYTSISSLAVAFSDLGVSSLAQVRFNDGKSEHQTVMDQLVLSKVILSLLAFSICTVYGLWIFNDPYKVLANAIFQGSILTAPLLASQVVLISKLRYKSQSLVLLTQSLSWLIMSVVTIYFFPNLFALATAFTLASVFTAVVSGRLAKSEVKLRLKWSSWMSIRGFLLEAAPIGIASAAVIAYYRLPALSAYEILGATQAGIYGAAARLLDVLQAIPAGLLAGYLPKLAKHYSKGEIEKFRVVANGALKTMLTVSIAVSSFAYFFAGDLIQLIFGSKYAQSVALFQVLAIAFVPIACGWSLTPVLLAKKSTKKYAAVSLATLAFNFAVSPLLIPKFGTLGATFVTLLSEVLVSLLLYVNVRKTVSLQVKAGTWLQALECVVSSWVSFHVSTLLTTSSLSIIAGAASSVSLFAILESARLRFVSLFSRNR